MNILQSRAMQGFSLSSLTPEPGVGEAISSQNFFVGEEFSPINETPDISFVRGEGGYGSSLSGEADTGPGIVGYTYDCKEVRTENYCYALSTDWCFCSSDEGLSLSWRGN